MTHPCLIWKILLLAFCRGESLPWLTYSHWEKLNPSLYFWDRKSSSENSFELITFHFIQQYKTYQKTDDKMHPHSLVAKWCIFRNTLFRKTYSSMFIKKRKDTKCILVDATVKHIYIAIFLLSHRDLFAFIWFQNVRIQTEIIEKVSFLCDYNSPKSARDRDDTVGIAFKS